MNFSVDRSALLEAVTKLQRVVNSKSSMPVLEGILLSVEQGKLTLISYNLEMGMKKEIYAKCEEEGDIVINARLLADILRRINSIRVEISADSKLMCHIKGGEAVFDIMGMAAIDFPEIPSVSEGTKINISGDILSDMINGTLFAVASTEGTRPILTGVDISVKDGILQFVAIDGYRLAIRREKVSLNEEIEFIASGKAIFEAEKLISESTEDIEIIVGKRLLSLNIDGYVFISRLLEGEFVNYQKSIPTEYTQQIAVNKNDLIDITERVSLLISDSFSTPIRCNFSESSVTFSCATTLGRATENFAVDLEGDSFEIGLNSRYLLDALRAINDTKIKIRFKGSNAGVLLISDNEENKDYTYMIMPMRLKNDAN